MDAWNGMAQSQETELSAVFYPDKSRIAQVLLCN
jgi:hypothetical protein